MIEKTIRGEAIPALGFGTFELTGPDGEAAIRTAIEIGYRQIDTAIRYGNEAEVGRAIAAAGVPRGELFVTTKIWYDDLAPERVHQRVSESLERLGLDQVDLLLVHWPGRDVPLGETLAAFADEKARGRTRLIGVSNFTVPLLDEALDVHKADLFCNQVEYHPYLSQAKLLARMRRADMLLNAYQPIARGKVFQSELLQEIGRRHGKSAAQVTLRWLIQQDNVGAIPRSSRVENMRANLDIFDFELSEAEMAAIFGLARGERLSNLPWAPVWDEDDSAGAAG
ncbi:diketogulonate reductase-like aldo/keto reductase [Amaricoccus macauensis]|uniref:Diketogulonate reductase-like aldo/keto reductase n=1 Tax=Amaricoccus macauensis TaxID=57001 RepID=A0A840SKL5_9RHOB|nr:aldo/keto reductase [Amaricoccus macauensis]MBB5222477.1 diketogulonate reductase-like aldo/keto reductase [Amaricoccus macauensis]